MHTHYPSLTFSLLPGPVAGAAEKKPSRKRQHDFLQTTHYTAWCLLCSSTFIHYRPLYLHVASHWFNLNVSAWRQVSPPFGFQCLKDCDKGGRCGQGPVWLSLVQWSSLVSWSNLRDLESPLSPPAPLPYLNTSTIPPGIKVTSSQSLKWGGAAISKIFSGFPFVLCTFIWLKFNHRINICPKCRYAELKVLWTQYLIGLIKLWSWI